MKLLKPFFTEIAFIANDEAVLNHPFVCGAPLSRILSGAKMPASQSRNIEIWRRIYFLTHSRGI